MVEAKLQRVTVAVPLIGLSATWQRDEADAQAAWALYIELATRISMAELPQRVGLLREALASLHQLFAETRAILKAAGPGIGAHRESLGGLALTIINKVIRPFLSKWHTQLEDHEAARAANVSRHEHEDNWQQAAVLRGELETLRQTLIQYARALETIAGIGPNGGER